ncbi:hypothetical protein [Tychonema sp. BBK16]|uniref:hypothetical protein n=1 Tax=Tychonema sp. BBK16 TaxID=2699888 RepID=UPI0038D38AB5
MYLQTFYANIPLLSTISPLSQKKICSWESSVTEHDITGQLVEMGDRVGVRNRVSS